MATDISGWLNAEVITLYTTDSTNNYAMRLIIADKAQPGITISTQLQTHGKGQRGRIWNDSPSESLLMSVIVQPGTGIDQQPLFNMRIAAAVANTLQKAIGSQKVQVKWPNDIIVDDRKAGGILIENVLQGSRWLYAVVGIGMNVLQQSFPDELPNATSLYLATGKRFEIGDLLQEIRVAVIHACSADFDETKIVCNYNTLLYKKTQHKTFTDTDGNTFEAIIVGVQSNGSILLQREEREEAFAHGSIGWVW